LVSPNSRPIELGSGLQVIPGLSASFCASSDGFYLNLDQSFGVFYKAQTLLDFVRDLLGSNRRYGTMDRLSPEMLTVLDRYVKKLKLRTTHRGEKNRSFIAAGLCKETAASQMIEFTGEEKKTISVSEYFSNTYKPLQFPNLPLITFKVRGDQLIHIPLEVLEIVPMQKYSPKLNESMTASMIKIAAVRPESRFRIVEEKARELQVLNNEVLQEFGIAFDN